MGLGADTTVTGYGEMPNYDYECKSCGHRFELFQSMSDDPVKVCPKCGGSVRRLIGGGLGVIFKGSGFYVTDNRSSSGRGTDRHAAKHEAAAASSDTASATPATTKGDGTGSKESKSPTGGGEGVKARTGPAGE